MACKPYTHQGCACTLLTAPAGDAPIQAAVCWCCPASVSAAVAASALAAAPPPAQVVSLAAPEEEAAQVLRQACIDEGFFYGASHTTDTWHLLSQRERTAALPTAQQPAAPPLSALALAVSDHGVPQQLLDDTLAAQRKFFSLPLEQKMQIAVNKYYRCAQAAVSGSCVCVLHAAAESHLSRRPPAPLPCSGYTPMAEEVSPLAAWNVRGCKPVR